MIHTVREAYIQGFQIISQPVGKGTSQSDWKLAIGLAQVLEAACSTGISPLLAGSWGGSESQEVGQGTQGVGALCWLREMALFQPAQKYFNVLTTEMAYSSHINYAYITGGYSLLNSL